MHIDWFWLLLGVIPYSIKRQYKQHIQHMYFRALLWQLSLQWQQGHCSWHITFPWIEQRRL